MRAYLLVSLFAASCVAVSSAEPPPTAPIGIDESALDQATAPCEDFYQYACGGWIKKTEIPSDKPEWDRSFSALQEENLATLRKILDDLAAGKSDAPVGRDGPYGDKLADFYGTCMDEQKIEAASAADVKALWKPIDEIKDLTMMAKTIADLHLAIGNPIFAVSSQQDAKDATLVIAGLDQAGISLPDRDYYLLKDPKHKEILAKFETYVTNLLMLAGVPAQAAKRNAKTVIKIERNLSEDAMPRVERRDPNKIYHRLELAGIEKLVPRFPWKTYFAALGHPDIVQINVAVPGFFKRVNVELQRTPLADWKVYLKWTALNSAATELGKALVDEQFRFYGKTLQGIDEIEPRWKRCVHATDAALGEALARAFVRLTFGAEGKSDSLAMVKAIESAMEKNLTGLSWFDDVTRKAAFEKLHAVNNKIGYPDKWRSYDTLSIGKASHLANSIEAGRFETHRQLAKIGKPVDRTEWAMTPPTVNAYYDPSMNEMVFPAGILQPPFFAHKAPQSVNYGAIGMVMGHELTHGFDDEGRQFDAKGNLTDWWAPAVGKEFEKRAQCVVEQFDGYVSIDDLHLNGKLTLGENIADLGGIKLSYLAYQAMPKPAARGKLTDDQQFFVGFGQAWCEKRKDEYARMMVTVDSHSPGRFRVNGPLSNFAPFATAFQCKPGAKMVRPNACAVW